MSPLPQLPGGDGEGEGCLNRREVRRIRGYKRGSPLTEPSHPEYGECGTREAKHYDPNIQTWRRHIPAAAQRPAVLVPSLLVAMTDRHRRLRLAWIAVGTHRTRESGGFISRIPRIKVGRLHSLCFIQPRLAPAPGRGCWRRSLGA